MVYMLHLRRNHLNLYLNTYLNLYLNIYWGELVYTATVFGARALRYILFVIAYYEFCVILTITYYFYIMFLNIEITSVIIDNFWWSFPPIETLLGCNQKSKGLTQFNLTNIDWNRHEFCSWIIFAYFSSSFNNP